VYITPASKVVNVETPGTFRIRCVTGMAIWGWIALFSGAASVGVVLAMALVYSRVANFGSSTSLLLSFAVGTLLSSAFLGLIPEALAAGNQQSVLATILAGMLLFFALEKALIWRHCHVPECAVHSAAGPLIIVGDAFHNFVDGIVIASAFITSVPTGITASLAVIAHEIPQELGDLAILTGSGYTRRRAIAMNCLSSATTPIGAFCAYALFARVHQFVPYVLAISAASFLYIGTADLMPSLHRDSRPGTAAQFASLLTGVGVISALKIGLAQ
jgi:zinc and cadmium transporter